MITLPHEIAELRQYCVRVGKQPIILNRLTGKLTPKWKEQDGWLTLTEAQDFVARGCTVSLPFGDDWKDTPLDGIGYLNLKQEDLTKQIVGGDLDACRCPQTGILSPWARQWLEDTQPFYHEASPSLCGLRCFYKGHLPQRVDNVFGYGDQGDLPDETKERILAAKPDLKKKLDKGEPVWNGIELYEANRHLSLTGIESKTYLADDRSGALMIALVPILKKKVTAKQNGWAADMDVAASGNRLPELSILSVIDTSDWEESGGQLSGPHPTLGSTTGKNVVVNPSENTYCWMHDGINAGGDAWVWLAHESGAVPWEVPGEGLLRDPVIQSKTLAYAAIKGYIKEDQIPIDRSAILLGLDDVAVDKGDGDEVKWVFSATKATASILKVLTLAKAKGSDNKDPIYYYNGQIFVPDGERIINNILTGAGGDLANIRNKKEVIARIHDLLLCDPVAFDHDPYLLGVRNGVVDLRTGDFRPYSPDDLMTDQIQVNFDKDATCPNYIKFLKEVAPNEMDQCTLVDWFAIHAIKEMFPYIMFLNGLGRNGKGIYERITKRFFGEDAFCGMALEELTLKNNRFAGAELAGKRGQIVSEAGEEQHKGKRKIPTSFMKNSTGDGIIDSDRKNRSRVKFKPFHATTIDSNDMPLIDDMSKGWIERFCKVDMPFHYVDNPDPENPMERQKDPRLFEKLTTEEELSGILNLIIERTIKISETMTITKRPGEEMFAEYMQQSNSVSTFLERFCDYDEIGNTGKDVFLDVVYDAYKNWCEMTVCDKVDDRRFGSAVKKMCGNRSPERIHVDDHKKRIYRGFRFDANRYQAHCAPLKTIKRPLKTVTGPLGPLNDDNLHAVANLKNNIETSYPKNAVIGPDIDRENSMGADIEKNALKADVLGLLANPGRIEMETPVSESNLIRNAAILEHGLNGWIDARIVANKLKIPLVNVVNYLERTHDKTENEFGYRQKRQV